jgi:hypothetical protein
MDDSVHSPKALPLGWDITGFQPFYLFFIPKPAG